MKALSLSYRMPPFNPEMTIYRPLDVEYAFPVPLTFSLDVPRLYLFGVRLQINICHGSSYMGLCRRKFLEKYRRLVRAGIEMETGGAQGILICEFSRTKALYVPRREGVGALLLHFPWHRLGDTIHLIFMFCGT